MKQISYLCIALSLLTTLQTFCMNEADYQANRTTLQEERFIIDYMQEVLEQESQKLRAANNQEAAFQKFLTCERMEPIIDDLNNQLRIVDDMHSAEEENDQRQETASAHAFLQTLLSDDHSEEYLQTIFPYIEDWLNEATILSDITHTTSIENGDLEIVATYKGLLSIHNFFLLRQERYMDTYDILEDTHQETFTPIQQDYCIPLLIH